MSDNKEFLELVVGDRKCLCGQRYDFKYLNSKCKDCCQDKTCLADDHRTRLEQKIENKEYDVPPREIDYDVNCSMCTNNKYYSDGAYDCASCNDSYCHDCMRSFGANYIECRDPKMCWYCKNNAIKLKEHNDEENEVEFCDSCFCYQDYDFYEATHNTCSLCNIKLYTPKFMIHAEQIDKKKYLECVKCKRKICDECGDDENVHMIEYNDDNYCNSCIKIDF